MDVVPKNEYKFTQKAREAFMREIRERGLVSLAAKAAGISTTYFYQRKKIDPELEAEYEAAMDVYRASIEDEIRRRAIEGVVERKYHQGLPILDYELDEDGLPIQVPVIDEETGEPLLDKNGRPVLKYKVKGQAFVRHYSDQLLLAHARRHIPEYNERKSVDMKVTGLGELLSEIKDSTGLPSDEETSE